MKDDYLFKLVEGAEQVTVELAIAEVGDGASDLSVDEELVRHVVPVIDDTLQKFDEIWPKAFVPELVLGSAKCPALHFFRLDVELTGEQSFEAELQNLGFTHEYGVLLEHAPILVLIKPGKDLCLDLFSGHFGDFSHGALRSLDKRLTFAITGRQKGRDGGATLLPVRVDGVVMRLSNFRHMGPGLQAYSE